MTTKEHKDMKQSFTNSVLQLFIHLLRARHLGYIREKKTQHPCLSVSYFLRKEDNNNLISKLHSKLEKEKCCGSKKKLSRFSNKGMGVWSGT